MFSFPSSVTLVLDEKAKSREKCYILVNTGLPLFKNTIIGGIFLCPRDSFVGLAAHGVSLKDLQTLVLTHVDVDSAGNLNLFPEAEIFVGNKRVYRQFFHVQKTAPSFVTEH